MATNKIKLRVGDEIVDDFGNQWLVARAWSWPKWTDLELIQRGTGEIGQLRIAV